MNRKNTIHNKDVFQRANYLHQASLLMADKNTTLSCYYGNLMKQIQMKSQLRIDPSIKRDFCKRCSIALTPATSEISASDTLGVVKCMKCGYEKNYPLNDYYKLSNERDINQHKVIEITQDQQES